EELRARALHEREVGRGEAASVALDEPAADDVAVEEGIEIRRRDEHGDIGGAFDGEEPESARVDGDAADSRACHASAIAHPRWGRSASRSPASPDGPLTFARPLASSIPMRPTPRLHAGAFALMTMSALATWSCGTSNGTGGSSGAGGSGAGGGSGG